MQKHGGRPVFVFNVYKIPKNIGKKHKTGYQKGFYAL